MKNIAVDLVIIGGGPAGISAGIYAAMDNANYLLIESRNPCWFMESSINSHSFVDGFTGTEKSFSGTLLKKSFLDHYLRLGGKIFRAEVVSVFKDGKKFKLLTKNDSIVAKAVIIASGTKPRVIKIEGAEKFNNEIHFDCVVDGKNTLIKKS